jgi:two-component system OmpR family sensor kinase
MRVRLFWKILFGFWLTFLGIMEALWLAFTVYGTPPQPFREAEVSARMQLGALAEIVHSAGPSGVEAMLAAWPSERRADFEIAPAGDGTTGQPGDIIEQDGKLLVAATDPSGSRWRLNYDLGPLRARFTPRGPFDWPPQLLAAGVVGGLTFSVALGWYLTRPIRRLQSGFHRLAAGDLETRLQPEMGSRRDELADLARDFDQMAAKLQQLISGRDQLFHDVSHELRSPLTRLQVAIDLARQNPQRLESTLDRIAEESRRLNSLVSELLTLARMEAGTRGAAADFDDYFDLGELLKKVTDDARFEAEASGILISTEFRDTENTEDEPILRGNAELIRRALENVIRNAIRHSNAGQQVAVAMRRNRGAQQYEIRIADQGPGVPPQALSTIFEPFVRIDNDAPGKPASSGFGLGLAIARRAVDAHRGEIFAENLSPHGLAVTIALPLSAAG